MSDPADLNDRLLQAVLKAEPASQIMFDVANGDDQAEVPTLSGPIPSLAKWLKDKGNALVDSAAALQDYPALRAYTGPLSIVRILKPGITGFFQHDPADTTSADNNGTIIVGTDERRWKRQYDGPVYSSWFEVVGGAGVDETSHILDALNAMSGIGVELVIQAIDPTQPVYINAPVPIEYSNLTVRFRGTLLMGPPAYVRVNGGLKEIVRDGMTGNSLPLRAVSTTDSEGRMVLPLRPGHGAFVFPDDRIIIRGENDKYGKPFVKQITSVVSVSGDDVTCADEPDTTFQPTYPDSDWPPDHTTGTTVSISAFKALTVDAQAGDITVDVGDTTIFTVGDLCYISDIRTEADFMAEMDPPVVSTLRSMCNMEIATVVAKTATTLTFDRHLERSFPVEWGAGVAIMEPVSNTHIIADTIKWSAPQPDRRNSALAINYGQRCTIQAQLIDGSAGRIGAAARIGYSHDCHIVNTRAVDAYRFESAEGYGLTLYYSTLCSIKHSYATGCRHNYLVQTCTLWEISHNYCGDDRISGVDGHGANAVKGWVHHNIVTRSKSHAPGVTNGGGIRIGNTSHAIGDHDTVIEDNWISGYLGSLHSAIDVSPSSRDVIVQRNTIQDAQIGFRHYKVSTGIPNQHSNKVTFQDNTLIRVAEPLDVENFDGNSYWDELILKRNTFRECGPVVVWDIPKVLCKGNDVEDMAYVPGQHAFEFRAISDLRVQGCSVDGAARGVSVTNCGTAAIVRNWLGETVEGVPVTDGGGNGTLIDLSNDNGVTADLIDGGSFSGTVTDTIDGGAFADSVGTTYDGGSF